MLYLLTLPKKATMVRLLNARKSARKSSRWLLAQPCKMCSRARGDRAGKACTNGKRQSSAQRPARRRVPRPQLRRVNMVDRRPAAVGFRLLIRPVANGKKGWIRSLRDIAGESMGHSDVWTGGKGWRFGK